MQKGWHVVVVGNYIADRQMSMLKFANLMVGSLQERDISAELSRPKEYFSRFAPRPGSVAKWLGYVDKFIVFPLQLRRKIRALPGDRRWRTVVHICDHSNSRYIDCLAGMKHVVTCHDLIAIRQAKRELPGPSVPWTGRILQSSILGGLRRARWIACDSDNTRQDLLRATVRPTTRTVTIRCQLNHPFAPVERSRAWSLLGARIAPRNGPLVLHVGNNSWYKNRDGVLRIFATARQLVPEASPRLVVIGGDFSRAQTDYITRNGLGDCIQRLPEASPQELEAAYSVADVFLFPSLYEGFGWPPIEAQACGCPVVAGTGGSLAEVLGDSALTADAGDETRLAGFVANALQAKTLRAHLRARGLRNVDRFRAPRMIDEYVALYERILEERAGHF